MVGAGARQKTANNAATLTCVWHHDRNASDDTVADAGPNNWFTMLGIHFETSASSGRGGRNTSNAHTASRNQ